MSRRQVKKQLKDFEPQQCIHAARYGRTKHFATTARLRLDSFKPVNLSMTLWAFARFEPQWPWPGWHSIISCFGAYYINLSCLQSSFWFCWSSHDVLSDYISSYSCL
jgi:hypothetical protein